MDFILNNVSGLTDKSYSIALFIDCSKALDSIPHERLLFKINLIGFRGPVFSVIESYLYNRRKFIDFHGNFLDLFSVSYGILQGYNLAPLLFNLYTSDLPHFLRIAKPIEFADDTTLHNKGNNQDIVIE
jgi:hypothetical protein